MDKKFNLSDYTHNIQAIAAHNKMSAETAMNSFITNLTVMRETTKGCPDLNFHELGQQWNKLLSKEKVAQKKETLARLQKVTRKYE